jgi:hypothetical protein
MLDRLRLPSSAELASVFLYRPKYIWFGLGTLLIVIVESVAISANNGHPAATGLRWAGFLMGIFGLLLVAYGLERTRRKFGKPSPWSRLKDWGQALRGLLVRRPPRVIIGHAAMGEFGSDIFAATGTVTQDSIEARLAALERRADAADKRIAEVQAEARREVERVRSEHRAAHGQLEGRVGALGKQVEDLAVGGLDLEFMGLVWLISGSVLSTFHEELGQCPVWRIFG